MCCLESLPDNDGGRRARQKHALFLKMTKATFKSASCTELIQTSEFNGLGGHFLQIQAEQ